MAGEFFVMERLFRKGHEPALTLGNTKSHLRRLKRSGRPEVLTINGRAALIVQDAAACKETLEAIRGIQRGLDGMKAGTGKPFRAALDEIRARHKIPRSKK